MMEQGFETLLDLESMSADGVVCDNCDDVCNEDCDCIDCIQDD